MARKCPHITQTMSGMASPTYTPASPGYVSSRNSLRSTRYSGVTMAICGNIEMPSTIPRTTVLPGTGRRASAYAHSAASTSATSVDEIATMALLTM